MPQPGNCIQNPARLETDLARQGLWHPHDHLANGLFGEKPVEVFGQVAARDDVEGGGNDAAGVREGDAGSNGTEIKRGDASRVGFGQGLTRAGEVAGQDLTRPRQGLGDGFEVTPTRLGHRRPAAASAPEDA